MSKLRKTDWYSRRNSKLIQDDEIVRLTFYPHGARCTVELWENSVILRNGEHSVINSTLGDAILAAGLDGEVVINAHKSLPQVVSRYLTWWLATSAKEPEKVSFKDLTIASTKTPSAELPMEFVKIKTAEVRAVDVIETVMRQSNSPDLSIVVAERDNGEVYELEPTRSINGTVLSLTKYGFIVQPVGPDKQTPFLVRRVSKNAQIALNFNNLAVEDLVGKTVRIQYTMRTRGTSRLASYKAPIVYSVDGLELDIRTETDAVQRRYSEGVKPIMYPEPTNRETNALLAVSVCHRAKVEYMQSDKSMVIKSPNANLLTLRPGCDYGQYGVILNNGVEDVLYHLDSKFDISLISPPSFVKFLDSAIYPVSGLSAFRMGIYYKDSSGEYVGSHRIN